MLKSKFKREMALKDKTIKDLEDLILELKNKIYSLEIDNKWLQAENKVKEKELKKVVAVKTTGKNLVKDVKKATKKATK
jgi:ribosomal protein L29